ncbi:MAG: RNA pseudouridine synthase [Planctomycetota bacterium]
MLVVDKPAGVLVVPAPGRRGATVVDLVSRSSGARVRAVHRLDVDTSGVLVLARTDASETWLEAVFREHRAERTYLALVGRTPSPPAGRIESRLIVGKDGIVRSVPRGGEVAITDYRVVGRRGGDVLVECKLQTGRRNQIRVHMHDLGCPLCGDRKYGWRARPGSTAFPRVMLHAERIVLPRADGRPSLDVAVDAPEAALHRDR